jgi:hypothetical protein
MLQIVAVNKAASVGEGGNITGVSYLTIDLTARRLMCGLPKYFNFA